MELIEFPLKRKPITPKDLRPHCVIGPAIEIFAHNRSGEGVEPVKLEGYRVTVYSHAELCFVLTAVPSGHLPTWDRHCPKYWVMEFKTGLAVAEISGSVRQALEGLLKRCRTHSLVEWRHRIESVERRRANVMTSFEGVTH